MQIATSDRCSTRVILLGVLAFFTAGRALAEVKLPAIISNHMVVQSAAEVPIWGWASPGEEVVVSVGKVQAVAKAGADGRWKVTLAKLDTGGPHRLTIQGTNTMLVEDVLVGEVWLGSGQSNMAMAVNRASDFEREQAAADLPQIRMFTVASGASEHPQEDCRGEWVVCSPQSLSNCSRSSTTNFVSSRRENSPTRSQGRPSKPRHRSLSLKGKFWQFAVPDVALDSRGTR